MSKTFTLIKSLNKSEVSYFRKHARRNATNEQSYLTIFNEILKMTEYDEQKLIKKLAIKTPHLKVVKSQLYSRIISKLHEFHLENSIEEKVKKDIHICKILIEKNLEKQAPPILRRIRITIFEYELFEQLPDLLKIEQLIWDKNWYKDISESDIRILYNKMIEGLDQQRNLSLYQMYRCIVQKAHFDKIRLQEDIKFIPDEAFKSPKQATSLRAKIEYYKVLATYHFMTGTVGTAYEYNKELLKIYEENINMTNLFPKDYVVTLNRYLIDSLTLGEHNKLEKGIEKMERLLKQTPFEEIFKPSKVMEMLYRLKFNKIIGNKDFKAGLELLGEFEPLFKKYKSEIPIIPQITFCYIIAYILLANGQYKKTLLWLSDITQGRPNAAEEICLFAESLKLVAQYECNYSHLGAQITNAKNRIRNKRELYQSEKQLFALLRELSNAPLLEKKEVFKRHLPIISKLSENPNEARFYDYFDLLHWVQSKV